MDPNSILGQIFAQIGQEQAPPGYRTGGGMRPPWYAPVLEYGRRDPTGYPVLDQGGARLAQIQAEYLRRAMEDFGPPPQGIATSEQMRAYYDGLYQQKIGLRPAGPRPTGEQP